MLRILGILIVCTIVSGYYFPFGLTILPSSVNTKMILAVIGVVLFLYHRLKRGDGLGVVKELLGAAGFAILFSIICFIAADYNETEDYSYARYITTFFVWLGGAYTVVTAIRCLHGEATIRNLTAYLASVSAFQCIIALIIDRSEYVKIWVDRYVRQGTEYLHEVNRLYGIGASLDTAGVRFAVVLVMIAFVLAKDNYVKTSRLHISFYLSLFFIIAVVGNMISRTTLIGVLFAFIIFVLSAGIHHLVIHAENKKIYSILIMGIIITSVFLTYLYQTNPYYHRLLRFAFEGFFEWSESGVWRTDSSDTLNSVMWIWPNDFSTWLIGSGRFGFYVYSTDIGYCRFILYCGLIGFGVFILFFIYNTTVLMKRFYTYRFLFFSFLLLCFIIWLKVATDLFFIYALCHWLDWEIESERILRPGKYENRLLYSRYL